MSEDLPLTAIAVGTRPDIEGVLNQTLELNRRGLVTLERARLLSEKVEPVGIMENADEATRLTVYFGRRDRVYMVPAFEVICELLYRRGIPAPPPSWASTASPAAAASGPASSAATRTCR